MKAVLLALLLLVPAIARAASPVENYLASRDRYIAKIKRLTNSASTEHDRAMADLEGRLRKIVGSFEFKGFSIVKINLGSLDPGDMGFGTLDGLTHWMPDYKAQIVVSTDTLLRRWLRAERAVSQSIPRAVDAALRSEEFYNLALQTDAHIYGYGAVPVTTPANSKFAFAMLAARSQDASPQVPDELLVAIVQGTRVAIASVKVSVAIDPLPACEALAQEYKRKQEEISAARTANPDDKKLREETDRLSAEEDSARPKCFAERAPGETFFGGVTEQVQGLADSLTSAFLSTAQ